MSGALEFFFNLVLVILLTFTVAYCWRLNRRISILQDSKSELANLLQHFDASTTRASESIVALQSASKKIGETIQARIDKANYAMDDLTFLIERASAVADTLETGLASARQRERISVRSQPVANTPAREAPEERLPPPRPVRVPLKEEAQTAGAAEVVEKETPSSGAVATLQAMLEKLNSLKSNSKEKESPKSQRPRSRAEQELMELIRNGPKS